MNPRHAISKIKMDEPRPIGIAEGPITITVRSQDGKVFSQTSYAKPLADGSVKLLPLERG